MVSIIINLEVMSWVGAEHSETYRGWHEKQKRDTDLLKTNGSKLSSSSEKVGNITVFTYFSDCYPHYSSFQVIPKYYLKRSWRNSEKKL